MPEASLVACRPVVRSAYRGSEGSGAGTDACAGPSSDATLQFDVLLLTGAIGGQCSPGKGLYTRATGTMARRVCARLRATTEGCREGGMAIGGQASNKVRAGLFVYLPSLARSSRTNTSVTAPTLVISPARDDSLMLQPSSIIPVIFMLAAVCGRSRESTVPYWLYVSMQTNNPSDGITSRNPRRGTPGMRAMVHALVVSKRMSPDDG